jgi:metal-sulfur cluster biosynthetic enzyme
VEREVLTLSRMAGKVQIEMLWEPPCTMHRMSEAARLQFGLE